MIEKRNVQDDNDGNGDDWIYLDDIQVKRFLTIITETSHKAVCKLLLNGITVNEILKLRARDIKYKSHMIALKKPNRRIKVDEATIVLLVEHINRQQIHLKSKEKVIKFTNRAIRDFVRRYGKIAHLDIDVNPSVLLNTFYIIKLELKPEWNVQDYAEHLGIKSLDHLNRRLDYFKKEHAKLTSDHKMFDHKK